MSLNKLLVPLVFSMLFGSAVAVADDAADYNSALNAFLAGYDENDLIEMLVLAKSGHMRAQSYLGLVYIRGMGVPQDSKKAVKWYTLAAEQGSIEDQYYLALMYERGEHVTKNDRTAFYWWTKAADQGSPIGQDGLASMYRHGKGVPENDKIAIAWYSLSAQQGYSWAQYSLAEMYEDGEGVLADYLRSYMWWNLSASNDNGLADLRKKRLAENMTAAQITKAQDMSSRCFESGYTDCWMIDKEAEDNKTMQPLAEIQQALDSLLVDEGTSTYSPDSVELTGAVDYIRNEIRQRWVRPADARTGMVVELGIELVPTGEIVNVEVLYRDASATDAFVASVNKAVLKVARFDKLSELNIGIFDANFRNFTLKFKPEDLRL